MNSHRNTAELAKVVATALYDIADALVHFANREADIAKCDVCQSEVVLTRIDNQRLCPKCHRVEWDKLQERS